MVRLSYFLLLGIATCISCGKQADAKERKLKEPIAPIIKEVKTVHGIQLEDDYAWMRDPKWPKIEDKRILDYIKQENAYSKAYFADSKSLIQKLLKEFKAREEDTHETPPIFDKGYITYTRTYKGKEKPVHLIKKDSPHAPERILLDENKIKGTITKVTLSPNKKFVAYGYNANGDEVNTIYIKNIETGEILKEKPSRNICPDVGRCIVWSADSKGFFYFQMRGLNEMNYIFYHQLGTDASKDRQVFDKKDDTSWLNARESYSGKYMFLVVQNSEENDVYIQNLEEPTINPMPLIARKKGHMYTVDHQGDSLFVLDQNLNGQVTLVKSTLSAAPEFKGETLYESQTGEEITNFYPYEGYIMLQLRKNGNVQLSAIDVATKKVSSIQFDEEIYDASIVPTSKEMASKARITYSSLTSPGAIYDYDSKTAKLEKIQSTKIPTYNPADYEAKRVWATASDGTKIPISLLYKKALLKKDGANPLRVIGYGSYGIALPPTFSPHLTSLLDRGFVLADAHIRGGGELGVNWYRGGKLLNKENTFSDYIACVEYLVKEGYGARDKVIGVGGSAGGLLMGAVVNKRPDLLKAAIVAVPFVDALNTMLDTTFPAIQEDYDEWGNPTESIEYFNYIKGYCPYYNVGHKNYPALRVAAGLNDSRVPYWDALKWVAKLRKMRTNKATLILDMDMNAGHLGLPDLDRAKDYVFMMKEVGMVIK